jgi:hypothetical protein
MVRYLQGVCARNDFLLFLDKCGLGNRYSFFYMPCKEHRNIPAGFAFVNFASAHDVLTLHSAVARGLWREVCGSSPTRAPAVSYARCQGHDSLVEHFSLSAVLHEQDPDKRPIFKPEVAKQSNGISPMETNALGIPGPPGIADDVAVTSVADIAAGQDGASAAKPSLTLSSKGLQDAVEALFRRQLEEKAQAATKQESNSNYSSTDEAAANQEKVQTMVGSMGDEESDAFCARMTGA